MKPRIIAAVSLASLLLAAAPALSQGQLPRPGQLPPAGGPGGQGGPPPRPGQAAPPQQQAAAPAKPYKAVAITAPAAVTDPSFEAFRKQLGPIAEKKDRKDTICSPADPTFNPQELEALAKATGTEEGDWAYPTQTGLEVHSGPQPNSPVVEKLGLHFVRVMEDNAPGNQQSPMLKVVTPSGKTGYVPAEALSPLGNDELCFTKEASGWKISGFIGGE